MDRCRTRSTPRRQSQPGAESSLAGSAAPIPRAHPCPCRSAGTSCVPRIHGAPPRFLLGIAVSEQFCPERHRSRVRPRFPRRSGRAVQAISSDRWIARSDHSCAPNCGLRDHSWRHLNQPDEVLAVGGLPSRTVARDRSPPDLPPRKGPPSCFSCIHQHTTCDRCRQPRRSVFIDSEKFSYQVGNVSSGRTTKCSGTVTERPLSIETVTSKRLTVDGGFGASFTVP